MRINPVAMILYGLLVVAAFLVSPWFLLVAGVLLFLSNVLPTL